MNALCFIIVATVSSYHIENYPNMAHLYERNTHIHVKAISAIYPTSKNYTLISTYGSEKFETRLKPEQIKELPCK